MAKKKKALVTKTCHTKCFVFDTLWVPGDVYEGELDPGKHFSDSGEIEVPPPPPTAGDDGRSNAELRAALKAHPFNFTAPSSWPRKKIWQKLYDLENSYARDEATNPNPERKPNITDAMAKPQPPQPPQPPAEKFVAPCGKIAKSGGGLAAHIRKCRRCQEIEASKDGDKE